MYNPFIKRCLDILLSLLGLVLLLPIFLIIAALIKISSPGPVFFKQKRLGKNNLIFEIYKFRSMRSDTPKNVPTHQLKKPDQYITSIGRFLRKTSLDELPQLINILKGEMSIIGPRPSLPNQYDLNELRNRYGVFDIKPGLTGLAQINGRDELEIKEKAILDAKYKENLCFLMDCKCFIKTFTSVLKHEGVVEGSVMRDLDKNKN